MGTSLDELLNAEFKEAFDEFDKVYLGILVCIFIRFLLCLSSPCIVGHFFVWSF